jgi:3-methyladenine DNA glycosylase/8-oxoguanine DNA glycosylase
MKRLSIKVPDGFNLVRTAGSHGWGGLLPFEHGPGNTLVRVLDYGAEFDLITITISAAAHGLTVQTSRSLSTEERRRVERDVRHILRLDEDLADFYSLVDSRPEFAWIARFGAGRLLRSPTVYEDLVKSLCTTNCSWALTVKMVEGLVGGLGRLGADGRRAFPTPEAMASAPVEFYRAEVRAGYRAAYLKQLAERVAAGQLDPEAWLTSELPTAELKREMKGVLGVGDYAAENLLKLVGRYDVLALDSWVRAKFARTRNRGRPCADERIARRYARFKEWRGLALWCDMTRDWFEIED